MILISGATGFLGSYLLYRLIKEGHKIRAVKRTSSNFKQVKIAFDFMNKGHFKDFDSYQEKIEWIDADLTELDDLKPAFQDVSEVFHLSGVVSFQAKDKLAVLSGNVGATKNMVNLSLQNGIKRFHFASSISSLGRGNEAQVDESDLSTQKSSNSIYGMSKLMSELEVWRAFNEGSKGIIINPGVVIGPAIEENDISKIFRLLQKGFNYYTTGINGYVDVRDVADFMYEMSRDEELFNERYLLVSENVSYKDLFALVDAGFGLQNVKKEANDEMSRLVSLADRLRAFVTRSNPIITAELLRLATSKYYYDNSKVKKALNKEFISIGQSVADTCEYLKYA